MHKNDRVVYVFTFINQTGNNLTLFHGKYQIDERYRFHKIGSKFSQVESQYETREKQLLDHIAYLRELDSLLNDMAFDIGKVNEYLTAAEVMIEKVEQDDFDFAPDAEIPPNLQQADVHLKKLRTACEDLRQAKHPDSNRLAMQINELSDRHRKLQNRYDQLRKDGRTIKMPKLSDTRDYSDLEAFRKLVKERSDEIKHFTLEAGIPQSKLEESLLFFAGQDKECRTWEIKYLNKFQAAKAKYRIGSNDEQTYTNLLMNVEEEYRLLLEASRLHIAMLEHLLEYLGSVRREMNFFNDTVKQEETRDWSDWQRINILSCKD